METFSLPLNAYKKITKIILWYFDYDGDGTNEEISRFAKTYEAIFSKNKPFLRSIGILSEKNRKHIKKNGLTKDLGKSLGAAIKYDSSEQIKECWKEVVCRNSILLGSVNKLSFGMRESDFVKYVLPSQQISENSRDRATGVRTILEVLIISGLVENIDGIYKKSSFNLPVKYSVTGEEYISSSTIDDLRKAKSKKWDIAKLIEFCDEINGTYKDKHYLATALLIRSLMNHVPPIFGFEKFVEVVNNSSRSRKELFKSLEENFRDVADLHAHDTVREKATSLTKNQLAPFIPSVESLISEIIAVLKKEILP